MAACMGLVGIVAPVLVFLSLLPLALDSLPYEAWGLYYYAFMKLVFLAFGSHHVWLALKVGPSTAASALWYVCAISSDAAWFFLAQPRHPSRVPGQLVAMFSCLLFPVAQTVLRCAARGALVKEALSHALAMMVGAFPPFVAASSYYLLHLKGWRDSLPALALALLLWSLTPPLVKALGRPLCVRGSPAIPAMVQVLWAFYVELAFGAFGFLIFSVRPASAIAYALSLAPALLVQLLAGTRWAFRLMPYMGTLRLHRLALYLEAFAVVTGEVSAYTLFLSFSILKLHQPSRSVVVARARLLVDQHVADTWSVNAFDRHDVTEAGLGVGFAGLFIVLCVYAGFVLAVPMVWRPPAGVSPFASAPREGWDKPDDGDSVGSGASGALSGRQGSASDGSSSPCQGRGAAAAQPGQQGFASEGSSSPCQDRGAAAAPPGQLETASEGSSSPRQGGGRGRGAVAVEGSLTPSKGWLHGIDSSRSGVLRQQHEVVLAFILQFKVSLLLTPVFVFAQALLMVNLAVSLHLLEMKQK